MALKITTLHSPSFPCDEAALLVREPDKLDGLALWNALKLTFLLGFLFFKNNSLQIGVSPLVSAKYNFFVYEIGSHLHFASAWNSAPLNLLGLQCMLPFEAAFSVG